jgi:hypothetical protein
MRTVEQVAAEARASVELAHGWLAFAIEPITLPEAEAALREPAVAVPAAAAARLGALRLWAVPFLACGSETEFVSDRPPEGESHSSLWLESHVGAAPRGRPAWAATEDGGRPRGVAPTPPIDLFISFRDANAHDAGFELLAAAGELLARRTSDEEFAAYARLIEEELREGSAGEIDEEALEAREAADPDYLTVSLASTLAEYMHALWHDVEVRHGPEDLAEKYLARRFRLLAQWFPPNPGCRLFV